MPRLAELGALSIVVDVEPLQLYPEPLRDEIDEVSERIYTDVNNAVYQCGSPGHKRRTALPRTYRHQSDRDRSKWPGLVGLAYPEWQGGIGLQAVR